MNHCFVNLLASTLASSLLMLSSGCRSGASSGTHTQGHDPTVTFISSRGEVSVAVEIADDPHERERGLMYRKELPPFGGMLFVFPSEAVRRFWMKNTYISLDMIFVSAARTVVGIVSDTEPMTTELRGVDVPSQFVVEVAGGFAIQHGITVGDPVVLTRVDIDAVR